MDSEIYRVELKEAEFPIVWWKLRAESKWKDIQEWHGRKYLFSHGWAPMYSKNEELESFNLSQSLLTKIKPFWNASIFLCSCFLLSSLCSMLCLVVGFNDDLNLFFVLRKSCQQPSQKMTMPFYTGHISFFFLVLWLNYDRSMRSTFCFIKSSMQIAIIHPHSVKNQILNHNKSPLFSSTLSYCLWEKRKLLSDTPWNYVML